LYSTPVGHRKGGIDGKGFRVSLWILVRNVQKIDRPLPTFMTK